MQAILSLLVQPPALADIGCFKDNKTARALPRLYANFRGQVDWSDHGVQIRKCGLLALANGYRYFGVQYYGECWSAVDPEGPYSYDLHGGSQKCTSGVGEAKANYVYGLEVSS